ncbi:MAG: VWA-like domain-containing protein [Eubacteriales bacterium]|nr:VWA-like domain-containing protein [Eubacteriales bacterium]
MGNRVELEQMGKKILEVIRNELFLSMHFMGPALNSLDLQMDLWTKTIGTDAVSVRFNPNYLYAVYLEHPYRLDRAYMHMLMHCLFRHMFSSDLYGERDLWDLCCDIAAEAVVDSMDVPVLNVVLTDYREAVYEDLNREVGVLTAERLYRYFTSRHRDYDEEARMAFEFACDDHSFWDRMEKVPREDNEKQEKPPAGMPPQAQDTEEEPEEKQQESGEIPPLTVRLHQVKEKQEEWEKNARKIQIELETRGSKKGSREGELHRVLALENRKRTDFREYLQKFSVVREEPGIDMDAFDYGYYNYGMQMYGNMPLFEELEYREAKKVEELVIAVDTSMSCQDSLVQKFLNDTAVILSDAESFFQRVQIHIIECDEKVQKVVFLESPKDMEKYAKAFHVHGGGGTDFRPVFRYITEKQRQGEMTGLRGLLYFTDGFGTYPEEPTPYETAFVFHREEEMDDAEVPGWAMKLFVKAEPDHAPETFRGAEQ